MRKFEIHTSQTAPAESQSVLEAVKKSMGMVPNLMAVMAGNPATLKAYATLTELFANAGFNGIEQQVIALTVSRFNDCHYCMAAHSMMAEMLKLDAASIENLRKGLPLGDTKLESLRKFTQVVVEKRGHISEDDLNLFLKNEYELGHVLGLLVGVSMKILSNYVNDIAKTPLDAPFKKYEWSK
jgi:AhpD family alkylhydroperoxidase